MGHQCPCDCWKIMTQSRYFIWRIAQTFGISMRRRHATQAATEFHLFREAEEVLGQLTWKETEHVEELSAEYWSLRRMSMKHKELMSEIEVASGDLQKSQNQREELLGVVADRTKALLEEREKIKEVGERLRSEHEIVISEARSIRRRHEGIKAKLEVLIAEGYGDTPEIVSSKEELLSLQKTFRTLRERRDAVVTEIETAESSLKEIESRIETKRTSIRGETLGNYQNLGRANRDLSQNRLELNSLEGQMNGFFAEVGRYVLARYRDPALAEVASKHHGLIKQISALGLSIRLNRILAGEKVDPAT